MQLNPEPLLLKIKRALDEEDVEGLLALDSPRDEYEEEAKLIAARVRTVTEFGDKTRSAKRQWLAAESRFLHAG